MRLSKMAEKAMIEKIENFQLSFYRSSHMSHKKYPFWFTFIKVHNIDKLKVTVKWVVGAKYVVGAKW